ncbi:MAG: sugar nucleotide-binding protein, partial [Patescibacteria group bacterium]|nr:sugar nucleotide-binding protein [Patescibacteria group bacterium]
MKVLVTGGTGRLGLRILRALKSRQHEVVSVSTHSRLASYGIPEKLVDLRNAAATTTAFAAESPEVVVHAA